MPRTRVADGFSSTEIIAICQGISYRMLDYWDKEGLVRPSVKASKGPGTSRYYSFNDVVTIRLFSELRNMGFDLKALRSVAEFIQRSGNLQWFSDGYILLAEGAEPALVMGGAGGVDDLRDRLMGTSRICLTVDLGRIVGEVREGAIEINSPAVQADKRASVAAHPMARTA